MVASSPQSELDKAMAGYQKASREHREAWDRLQRAERDHRHAEEADAKARIALTEARKALDAALDADGVHEP